MENLKKLSKTELQFMNEYIVILLTILVVGDVLFFLYLLAELIFLKEKSR